MPNLTSVGVTAGVPTSGTGTVSTIDALMADGGQATLGAKADAKSTATDTTAITLMQVSKQISASIQALAAIIANGGLTVNSAQLAPLATTAQAMSAGFQLTGLPTDQVVPNKVQAQTSGMTSSRVVASASSNTATTLKASAGAIGNIDVFNVAAYDVFLKFYNKASAPTVGTDTPIWTIPIKAGTGYARAFPFGKWFPTGVSYGITKLQADADTTALVASDLTGSIDWI